VETSTTILLLFTVKSATACCYGWQECYERPACEPTALAVVQLLNFEKQCSNGLRSGDRCGHCPHRQFSYWNAWVFLHSGSNVRPNFFFQKASISFHKSSGRMSPVSLCLLSACAKYQIPTPLKQLRIWPIIYSPRITHLRISRLNLSDKLAGHSV
jgi:hypothetical protein